MEKKGEGMTIEQVLIVLVAIAVILGVGYFAWNFFSDKANVVGNNIPGFGQTNNQIKSIEEVRYDVLQDKVQYYDGTTWRDFDPKSGTVTLGDKQVSEADLKTSLENYYFSKDSRVQRPIVYNKNSYALIVNNIASKEGPLERAYYGRNDIPLEIWTVNSNNVPSQIFSGGYYVYNMDSTSKNNVLLYVRESEDTPTINLDKSLAVSNIQAWLAKFARPVAISYKINDKDTSASFCPKQYGSHIIIEDLTKPTTEKTCP